MGNDNLRPFPGRARLCRAGSCVPFLYVGDESLRRTIDVVKIHRVRSDAGEFRALVSRSLAMLSLRYNFADGAPAQSAGAELERLIKAVVQFLPFAGGDKFVDDSQIKIGLRPGK